MTVIAPFVLRSVVNSGWLCL